MGRVERISVRGLHAFRGVGVFVHRQRRLGSLLSKIDAGSRVVIMPLPVVCFSTYLTSTDGVTWRADDYNARDFILAIKDRDVAGYASVLCRGTWRRFENGNRQDVVRWFGEIVAGYFDGYPREPRLCWCQFLGVRSMSGLAAFRERRRWQTPSRLLSRGHRLSVTSFDGIRLSSRRDWLQGHGT